MWPRWLSGMLFYELADWMNFEEQQYPFFSTRVRLHWPLSHRATELDHSGISKVDIGKTELLELFSIGASSEIERCTAQHG